ncbi:SPOR domain-containing protein [Halomonas koreensis]|uniref:SPOR domain-containing protein n=1 Tax=Halomonas koreensis TaxID=245385 RepID=A0ABU1G260_9GAMM|nr:SPOR domain-containing protein [Halomonas koreensis]MDR5867005.1 SPOR domain-containing protein [Halomonas koreensis]
MKYGLRERVSGALILAALGVIFVPLLFDEPAPREDRPAPTLTIEQPVEVARRQPAEPAPPASLSPEEDRGGEAPDEGEASAARPEPTPAQEAGDAAPGEAAPDVSAEAATTSEAPVEETPAEAPAEEATPADPIAELARAADARLGQAGQGGEAVPGGQWAVQVGSFGEPDNAERLEARLEAAGFPAYRRPRGNDLTSVYVGPYGTSEVAEDVMARLKAGENLQGLLVEAP